VDCHPRIKEYVEQMVFALDEAAVVAGGQAIAKLADDADLG
jgi:hypothetical protein